MVLVGAPPKGMVLVGARRWALDLAGALSDLGVPVLVVAESPASAEIARDQGLLVYAGRLEGDDLATALDGVGARLAVVGSGAESLETVGVDRVVRQLGRANVWRVARDDPHHDALVHGDAYEGGHPFGGITQEHLDTALADGAVVTALAPGRPADERHLPLVVVDGGGTPVLAQADSRPGPDGRLVVLALNPEQDARATAPLPAIGGG